MSPKIYNLMRAASIGVILAVSGCASHTAAVKGPDLRYENVAPLFVNVATVNVVQTYSPRANFDDVSPQFPEPPDEILRRYAQNRLRAVGSGSGNLEFSIDNASISHKTVEPDIKVAQWMKIGTQDEYEVIVRIGLKLWPENSAPQSMELSFRRMTTIPRSKSIAEREAEQRQFMADLMKDVDTIVTRTLHDSMRIAVDSGPSTGGAPPMPSIPVSPVDVRLMEQGFTSGPSSPGYDGDPALSVTAPAPVRPEDILHASPGTQ